MIMTACDTVFKILMNARAQSDVIVTDVEAKNSVYDMESHIHERLSQSMVDIIMDKMDFVDVKFNNKSRTTGTVYILNDRDVEAIMTAVVNAEKDSIEHRQ